MSQSSILAIAMEPTAATLPNASQALAAIAARPLHELQRIAEQIELQGLLSAMESEEVSWANHNP
jgi:hypothetical protein